MVRKQDVSDRELFSGNHKPVRRRVVKRRHALGVCFLVAMTIFVVLLPRLLTARSVLLPIIDRYAGLTPLRVDFESFSAGWFSPVVINGLQLIDGQGNLVAKIGAIDTQKGVLSWVFASQDLGTIRIRDVAVDIAVSNGTTSLESALEPMLSNIKPSSTEASSARMAGSIELSNAQIMLRDSSSPEAWLVAVPNLKTQLPEGAQVIGPTVLSATIAQAQGAATGSISAEVAEIAQDGVRTFNCLATLDHVPLAVWQVLHKRLPEVPLESLAGSISARISGSLVDGARWSMSVEQLTGDQLQVSAPQLIGAKPAKLDLLQVRGKAALASGRLQFEGTEVRTDFGGVAASGNLPWPVLLPTVTSPWLPNAQLSAEGNIDLARLVKVAESLVPMREDTRLTSGTATFRALQRIDANGQANSSLDLQLGDLVALAGGQQLTWDQPLKLAVQAEPQADGHVAFRGSCTAEFCQLMATGTADAGSFKGEVSLDKLQQRLAQWVQLPLKTMTGSADVDIQWNQPQPGLLATEGKLRTSPLIIEMASGGQLREPAWQGTFSAQSRLHANQISSIERGHLELVADSERLAVDLLEPLTLTQTTLAVQAPAAFTVSSEGALDLWQHRAVMLKLLDPGMTLAGKYSLGASGRVDLKHLELQQANWRSQPFEVGMGTTQIVEPEMVGNFQGRVDTADPTRLAVEKLVVQAHSFSLTAADAAATGVDKGRSGTGAFIVDLGQLMKNVRTNGDGTGQTQMLLPPGAGTPSNAPSDSQVALSGQVSGNMRWQVSSREATLDLDAKTGQMDVVRQTSSGKVERLWSEAQLLTTLQAAWDAATGNINVSSMQLQAPWMHYVGTLQVQNQSASQTIRANGQCLYDAGLVAAKLQPYLGNNIQLAGRKTVPVEVVLTTGGAPTTTSTLAGLQAATRVGWEQARVVGIEVGNADVPVVISAGQFSTQAEIPVSGGTVRFDVASDLTAPQTVIIQKPMTVLENVAITPQMCQGWLRFVAPLLSEVTSVDGRLSLQLNQARYNLVNPRDQIVDGQLIIHNAAIGPGPLSNQILGLAQQINAIRKRELGAPASNQQVWMQMPQQAIAFRMENGRVYHRDLKFHVGDVQLASSGSVDIDGQMEMNTSMPIPDDWIAKSPLLAGMKGQIMQFPIRGSLTSPQLDAQFLKDFGRQAITQAADGLIQQQLSRGLGKIFGQLPTPVGTPLQPNVTPETPPATTTAPRP